LTGLVQTDDSQCAGMPCTGNNGEYCGNSDRIQIFSRDSWNPQSTANGGTSTDVTSPSSSSASGSGSSASTSTLTLTTSAASAGSTLGPVSDSTNANKAAMTSAATTYSILPDSSVTGQVGSQATSQATLAGTTSSQATFSQATTSQATSSEAISTGSTSSQGSKTTSSQSSASASL
jgi:hypothetical protein